jgi:16S rRNA (cytosine967-C5)-methyltransferase
MAARPRAAAQRRSARPAPQRTPRRTARAAAEAASRRGRGDRAPRQSGAPAAIDRDAARPALVARGVQALERLLEFAAPADVVLRRFFQGHPDLGRRDRAFVAETAFACLRRLRWYEHLAAGRATRRLFLLAADRLEAAERRTLEPSLGAQERAWLASLREARDEGMPLGIRAELPDWVIDALRPACTEADILALGRGMQAPAPLDLRVNTLSAGRDAVLAQLHAAGIEARPTRWSPVGIRLETKPALDQHPLYLDGAIEVQDEGSQLLALLVAPRRGEMIIDFCAGAGGKTLLLGALMRSEGRLYAFDVSAHRIRRLHVRLARSGLSNVQPETVAHENDTRLKRLAGKLDRVLVDAPCTGLGTSRRNPDLKWRQTPADLAALVQKQAAILAAASRLLKPGGRLVYATCSFLPAENDAIVDAFLQAHPHFTEGHAGEMLAPQGIMLDTGHRLRLLPHVHATDGFFAAVLERQS